MMSFKKKIGFLLLSISCLTFSSKAPALEDVAGKREFYVKLSADNKFRYSQEAPTDLSFSMISGLAYISDKYDLNSVWWGRLGMGYFAIMVTTFNHEFSGHGMRVLEQKYKLTRVEVGLDLGGSTSYVTKRPFTYQKEAIISLGGVQANYLLSQKIASDLVVRNQKMDPVTGFGYAFSALDQTLYSWTLKGVKKDDHGHDINSYVRNMEFLYGEGSMSRGKVKSATWLNLLDPVLFSSLYSIFTGENMEIPSIKLGGIGIAPFAGATLTPYGSIEKKIGAYLITDYTPVKFSFSFGRQNKSSKVATLTQKESSMFNSQQNNGKVDLEKFDFFSGLNAGESVKKHNTYTAECTIYKILSFEDFYVGATGAFWKQPIFGVKDPYRAKPKNGGMLLVTTTYSMNDRLNILFEAGYKTKGFLPGRVMDKTPLLRAGFEWKL